MAERKVDMSAAAKKAWKTRRKKYGKTGLSKKPAEAEAQEEEPTEETIEADIESIDKEVREEGYFCDYCGAGPFEHSWEKATHVKNCEKAKEVKAKAEPSRPA